jgi:thiol:disulfide interchange protein
MKGRLLFFLGAVLLLLALLPLLRFGPNSIPWTVDASRAFSQARELNQPVLVFLYTDWCTYCRQMDQETFRDRELIRQMASEYVWLRLNAETDPEGIQMQRDFRVGGFPTLLILDSRRREIDRLEGYLPAARFVETVGAHIESFDSFGKSLNWDKSQPQLAEVR